MIIEQSQSWIKIVKIYSDYKHRPFFCATRYTQTFLSIQESSSMICFSIHNPISIQIDTFLAFFRVTIRDQVLFWAKIIWWKYWAMTNFHWPLQYGATCYSYGLFQRGHGLFWTCPPPAKSKIKVVKSWIKVVKSRIES